MSFCVVGFYMKRRNSRTHL